MIVDVYQDPVGLEVKIFHVPDCFRHGKNVSKVYLYFLNFALKFEEMQFFGRKFILFDQLITIWSNQVKFDFCLILYNKLTIKRHPVTLRLLRHEKRVKIAHVRNFRYFKVFKLSLFACFPVNRRSNSELHIYNLNILIFNILFLIIQYLYLPRLIHTFKPLFHRFVELSFVTIISQHFILEVL